MDTKPKVDTIVNFLTKTTILFNFVVTGQVGGGVRVIYLHCLTPVYGTVIVSREVHVILGFSFKRTFSLVFLSLSGTSKYFGYNPRRYFYLQLSSLFFPIFVTLPPPSYQITLLRCS